MWMVLLVLLAGSALPSSRQRLLGGHQPLELLEVNPAVAVEVGLLDHRAHLLIGERLAQVVHGQPQLLLRDEPVAVPVKDPKSVRDVLLHPRIPPQHHLDELVEVDSAVGVLVDVADHVSEFLFGWRQAVISHDPAQLAHRDLSVVVGVEQGEGLF